LKAQLSVLAFKPSRLVEAFTPSRLQASNLYFHADL
jgi:hypothetical protein